MQILCDFHNLHLESGRQYLSEAQFEHLAKRMHEATPEDALKVMLEKKVGIVAGKPQGVSEETFPDADERDRLLGFLRRYCPEVLMYSDSQSLPRDPTSGAIILNAPGVLGSLIWYELENGKTWFESQDYLAFVDHWRNIRALVDNAFDRKLDLHQLMLFQTKALRWEAPGPTGNVETKQYAFAAPLLNPEGEIVEPLLIYHQHKTVPLDSWKVRVNATFGSTRHGIRINDALYQIHNSLLYAIDNPRFLGKCRAERTKQREACRNIFVHERRPGPKNRYCSDRCRRRDYEAKKAKTKNRTK